MDDCSGRYALNSAFNYSGGWFQVGSAPTNSSVNRYTGSVKNDSNRTMVRLFHFHPNIGMT